MITALVYLAACQGKADTAKIVKPAPAVFADAATKHAVAASRNVYAKLKSARFSITESGKLKRYTYAIGQLAGAQEGLQWTFGSLKLTIKTSKGLFQGRVGPNNVNPWLAKAGAEPERLPIQLASGRNPIDVLVGPGSRVRKAGTMTIDGASVDVIEIKSTGLRVSVSIRRDNHLIVDLGAENVDRYGKVLFRSSRSIRWTEINRPISASTFHLAGKPKSLKSL